MKKMTALELERKIPPKVPRTPRVTLLLNQGARRLSDVGATPRYYARLKNSPIAPMRA